MKKYMAIAVLAVGVLIWRMGAMDQGSSSNNISVGAVISVTLQTSDKKDKSISIETARLFGVVNDILVDAPEDAVIPLPNVKDEVLSRILTNLDGWVITELYGISDVANQESIKGISKRSREERQQRALEAAQVRVRKATDFSLLALKERIEDLKAANYLQIPELVELYAKQIADLLASDDVLRLQAWGDATLLGLLSDASINRDFKHQIYRYMKQDFWYEQADMLPDRSIQTAKFSPDGNRVVMVDVKGAAKIYLWNEGKWSEEKVLSLPMPIIYAEFLSNGKELIIFYGRYAAKVKLDEQVLNPKILYTFDTSINYVALSADRSYAITSERTGRGAIFFLEGDDWKMEHWEAGDDLGKIDSAVFSSDNSKVAIEINDWWWIYSKTGSSWSDQGFIISNRAANDRGSSIKIFFRPDGSVLSAWGENYELRVYSWVGNDWRANRTIGNPSFIRSMMCSFSGKQVVTMNTVGNLYEYEENHLGVWTMNTQLLPYGKNVLAASLLPDGRTLGIVSAQGIKILRKSESNWTLEGEIEYESDYSRKSVLLLSPDGKRIMRIGSRVQIAALYHTINFDQALCLQLLEWARNSMRTLPLGVYIKTNGIIDAAWNSFSPADKIGLRKNYGQRLPQDKRNTQ